MEDNSKVTLSKSILDMKFMKRTKERVLKEVDDAEGKAMYSNEITDEMKKAGNIVFVDTSLSNCKDLIDGRLSFGGMNPEVEKLMANDYAKRVEQIEKKKEKDVTDEEMAKGYSTVVNTISKKFQNKKNRKGFVKPSEEDQY
ncbi:unnamed protein product [Brassicogethes aeneus]|uniref:M-phase phosphoprotein 6 n=1 Tax=Brassicogethes aeneus TaxID=1431903 RepID=A0A9P0FHH1_BRAAE|nr:unnamed protein product [Brassicogethes aeneus]